MKSFRVRWLLLPVLLLCLRGPNRAGAAETEARAILDAAGIKGGLVVHLGCGDGKLTAALHANESYLVHGLDADAKNVEAARKHILALGLYGKVCVEQWDGKRLPYIDNLANLIVISGDSTIEREELLRVLAPNGVALDANPKSKIQNPKLVKPRPQEMDEWTHYLHDPSNNAVAHDSLVGFPRRFQWIGGPRYSRHHDHMSSISAMVSANGRNFYIFDEGSKASILVPPKWSLVARDAFNGMILWKQEIPEWHTTLWPLKSGPQLLTRRLVAAGDRVYVTLGLNAPLTALDAATGALVRTYAGTADTEEILLSQGVLYLVISERPEPKFASLQEARQGASQAWPEEGKRRILAVEADTGKPVWEKEDRILPETLTVEGEHVLYHDGEKIVCLNLAAGTRDWVSRPLAHKSVIQSYFTPTLVAYKDVVLFSGGVDGTDFGGGKTPLAGLSAKDGSVLWTREQPECGHHTPKDILVANGLVWFGKVAQASDSGEMTACNPQDGEVVKHFLPDTKVPWFHHRCYRAKATDNYLLFSRTGIEFIDTTTNHWTPNNWVRGGCLYGIMPCNGLIYTPPHPCACYEESKLYGFTALAPAAKAPAPAVPEDARLQRGPVYAEMQVPAANPEDWPTYRHDASRSGSTKTQVPTELKSLWQTDLLPGGKLSSVVIADGKLFVSALNTDTVHALDANTGKLAWSYTAGGRVDSPPTIWEGRVLFGCADGYVYCLRPADGQLAWRYQAAPQDQRMVAYEQVESVWPVPGSVLVQDGVVYCVAGRSMFLDGGLRLLRLDAKTGSKLSETVMDDRVPDSKETLQSRAVGMNLPVAMPDVLSCDGRYVYMRSLPFDLQGQRKFVEYVPVGKQKGDDIHLFSPTGFLDDTMWHRTYWLYGRAFASSAGGYYLAGRLVPAGRIMVCDDNTVWGYGRRWQYYRWSTPYVNHLFATSKQPEVLRMAAAAQVAAKKRPGAGATPMTRFAYEWSDDLPVQVCAMVHAGQTLFVAGPPSFVDEDEAARSLSDPKIQEKVIKQGEAFDGRKGAILTAVSAADGRGLGSYRLASLPVFDGMAAAGGRLYLSTADGKVLCLGGGGTAGVSPALTEAGGTPAVRALEPAAEVAVTPRGDADKPPAAAGQAPAGKAQAAAQETKTHPDFQHLASVIVTSGGLGYKLAATEGETGLALKKLPAPLTQEATFKLKMRALGEGRLQTAFVAFGDGTTEEQLVKCGVRVKMKKAFIFQGAAPQGRAAGTPFECAVDQTLEAEVSVNLATRKVKMTLQGTAFEGTLGRALKTITYAGYCVINGVAEFSPIETSGK